jgi:bidirectional [NiFe] hydrogenase diaphorase subunit
MTTIDVHIDDKLLKVEPGKTILEVCKENGIDIPTMCHLEGIKDVGACR